MPAHRHRRTPVARAPRLARALALSLVVALLVAGCGGKDEKPKASKKDASAAAEPSASESADEEAAPDPGYGAPRGGSVLPAVTGQSLAPVTSSRGSSASSKHTTVVAHVGYVPKAVTANTRWPSGGRSASGCASRRTGSWPAGRSPTGRPRCSPGRCSPPRRTSSSAARAGCGVTSSRAAATSWSRCRTRSRCWSKGVPESLRVCQTAAGVDVSCSRPHVFRVEAVYAASGSAYPDPARYTAAARTRCKELMGKDGGYWQPPSRGRLEGGDRLRPVPVPGCLLRRSTLAPQPRARRRRGRRTC